MMNLTNVVLFMSLVTAQAVSFFGIHTCAEGHKCVYKRGGALLSSVNGPGYHLKIPLITSHHEIQTTWQTDHLKDVICGSSKGGDAHLDISVVNRLDGSDACVLQAVREHSIDYDKPVIFDPISSSVAQFCKDYPLEDIYIKEFDKLDEVLLAELRKNVKSFGLEKCLEVKEVRIQRPKLKEDMRKRFEAIELEQKAKDLAIQEKETERIKLETQLQREVMEKERDQRTKEISLKTDKMMAEADAERQRIIDDKELATKKKAAEAERYRLEQMAQGNTALHTPEHIKLEGYRSAHNNAKLIFGNVPENAFFGLQGLEGTLSKTV